MDVEYGLVPQVTWLVCTVRVLASRLGGGVHNEDEEHRQTESFLLKEESIEYKSVGGKNGLRK